MLLGVIDGLGHGPEAAAAAATAAAVLEAHAGEQPDHLLGRCHAALADTRGAMMTLASVDMSKATLTWCGVGDVAGIVFRGGGGETRYVFAPVRPGIVGLRMSLVRSARRRFEPGDTLVLASDDVRPPLDLSFPAGEQAQATADRLFADSALEGDDATVLVARHAAAGT